MPQGVVGLTDQPSITVSTLIGNPMWVPTKLKELLTNQFLADTLLRNAGSNANGVVAYNESTPLFLDDEIEEVAEFSEIPIGTGQIGLPRVAFSSKRGLGIRVSKDMQDMNQIGLVQTRMTQLKNTFIRMNDRGLRAALASPTIPTIAAAAGWDTANGRPRRDVALAQEVIASANPTPNQGEDLMGFEADTLVMSGALAPVLIDNDNFGKIYLNSPLVSESIQYTGKLPNQVNGLDALKSRYWPKDRVLVLERGTVGFYSDQRPLQITGLYPEGNGPNGGSRESYRSDATQRRTLGVDQPLAACWITGVVSQ